MIYFIAQLSEKTQRRKMIKCPVCTYGRIYDAPMGCQIKETFELSSDEIDSIIIKCPNSLKGAGCK